MPNITDIRDHQPMAHNDLATGGAIQRPSVRQYRMAYTITNLRLMTVFERAAWVAENPDWREYLEAFRRVCEYEAGNVELGGGGEAA